MTTYNGCFHDTDNGWSNYETWAVKLWLDNEEAGQALQQELLEQAQKTNPHRVWKKRTFPMGDYGVAITLGLLLEEWVTENNPLKTTSLYSDLLGEAIDEVNFTEIADTIIADNKQ